MPGRKPLPSHLKVLKGTDQKCRMNKNEPAYDLTNADCPEGMSDAATKHWPKIAKQLIDAGVMTDIDHDALMLYCETYSRYMEANKNIQKYGAVVKNKDGFPVQSPYLLVAEKAQKEMRALLVEFGMTPSSRARVSATEKNNADDIGFKQFK